MSELVVGLGFGDEGKGTIVDHRVRARGAAGVIRFGGGPQATHHVVLPDGRWHGFSQLGAGTFVAGVATHLTRDVLIEPVNLLAEAEALRQLGVGDALTRLTIDPGASLVLPYHKLLGQLAELARGNDRHGSVGLGVGEAARDRAAGVGLTLADCRDRPRLARHLADAIAVRLARAEELTAHADTDRARERLAHFRRELDGERLVRILHGFVGAYPAMLQPDDDRVPALLGGDRPGVLEGAQGVLLDPDAGFPPYVTKTPATPALADALLAGHRIPARRIGVLRAYAHRHGPGPLPTEDATLTARLPETHNRANPWQGGFRVGAFDRVLARHAVAVARPDVLALTCVDRLTDRGPVRVVTSYRHPGPAAPWWSSAFTWRTTADGALAIDAVHRGGADVTTVLAACRPGATVELASADELIELLASTDGLGVPVAYVSSGPTWQDKLTRP